MREELIQICLDAVVPFTKWNDRDSYSAQVNIQSIYAGLIGGCEFKVSIKEDTIDICFEPPTKEQKQAFRYLEIDSREDYFQWMSEQGEDDPTMFDGSGIDWNSTYLCGYLPTRQRLEKVSGGDWY